MKRYLTITFLFVCLVSLFATADQRWGPPKIDYRQNLKGLSLGELRILRNTVFALHGYDFKSKELSDFFWNKPWYQKKRSIMERKKEKFSKKSLSPAELRFIKRIKKREKKLKKEALENMRPGQLYSYVLIANTLQFPDLGDKSKRMIENNGFVVRPAAHEQFFNVYEDNDYRMIPSFITSDSILQLYHVFFDFTLRDVEKNKLLPAAKALSGQLLARAKATRKRTKQPEIKKAAELLCIYFAVAESLLSGKPPSLPPALRKTAEKELKLIASHAGRARSPLTGCKMDYSQFIPRGHYTRSKELKRYFKAMLWYGRVFFNPESRNQLRAALLMTYYLTYYDSRNKNWPGKLAELWKTIYEPTVFFVGSADDLSPQHVKKAMARVFGKKVFKVKGFTEEAKLTRVRKILEELNPQKIKTAYVDMPNAGIRFMGQRYIPDGEILQKLLKFPERSFPKGLDIFAVFGNPEARELLDDHYKEPEKWDGYLPARKKLRTEFAEKADSEWEQNLYWSWLDCLRVLIGPTHEKAPPFARSKAWRFKQLHTALASWTELRHDTILYAKPFGAECGGGDEPPKTKGYVEPVPAFFARLGKLLRQTRDGLKERKLLTRGFDRVAGEIDELLTFLNRVASKQINGEKVTEKEYEQIRLYGSVIGYLTTQLLSDFRTSRWFEVHGPDRNVAVVADIGTVQDKVLEEGVGTVDEIFVVVEFDGEPTLTRGAVFSYYEFVWPAADRLTDEKWQKMHKEGKTPDRPDWVENFLHNEKCPEMPDVLMYSSGC